LLISIKNAWSPLSANIGLNRFKLVWQKQVSANAVFYIVMYTLYSLWKHCCWQCHSLLIS